MKDDRAVRYDFPAARPRYSISPAAAPRAEVMQNVSVRKRARIHHHHVYVVELSREVLDEPRFRKGNPDYEPGKPCVYIGMTGLQPDERFDKHKAGIKA